MKGAKSQKIRKPFSHDISSLFYRNASMKGEQLEIQIKEQPFLPSLGFSLCSKCVPNALCDFEEIISSSTLLKTMTLADDLKDVLHSLVLNDTG